MCKYAPFPVTVTSDLLEWNSIIEKCYTNIALILNFIVLFSLAEGMSFIFLYVYSIKCYEFLCLVSSD
jgi:hypothetical protein